MLSLWCFAKETLVNSYRWEGVCQVKREWGVGRRGEDKKSRKKCGRRELEVSGDLEPGSEGDNRWKMRQIETRPWNL